MAVVLAVVKLAKKSGIPADAVQNTFTFTTPSTPAIGTELDAISSAVQAFYNTSHTFGGTTGNVAGLLAFNVSPAAGASTISFYDITTHLDGSRHGSPLRVDTWTLSAVGADSLPDELACVLSVHSDLTIYTEFGIGTRPRARHRGRLFIGPLAQSSLTADAVTFEEILAGATRNRIAGAAVALRDDASTVWAIWSRKNADVNPVTGGWVDNAFDVQRRRGNKPSLRSTF